MLVLAALVLTLAATPCRHVGCAPTLTVSSIEPADGPIAGGTLVAMRGESSPLLGAEVRFGDAPVASLTVAGEHEIRVTTAAQPD